MHWTRTWPYFLGAVLGVLLVRLLPLNFSRYELDILQEQHTLEQADYNFADMDGDGNQDIIICGGEKTVQNVSPSNKNSCRSFGIRTDFSQYPINQYNVPRLLETAIRVNVSDYNQNGRDELLVVSVRHDSLLLYVFEDFRNTLIIKEIFLDTALPIEGHFEVDVPFWWQHDYNMDGYDEVVLSINNSFPVYPRRVVKVDIWQEQVERSPATKFTLNPLNGRQHYHPEAMGGFNPIFGNLPDLDLPHPDTAGYAFLLDRHLQFRFPPIPVTGYPGEVRNMYWQGQLITAYQSYSRENQISLERRNPHNGQLLHRVYKRGSHPHLFDGGPTLIVANNQIVYWFNEQLKVQDSVLIPNSRFKRVQTDLNGDQHYEHILYDINRREAVIYDEKWLNPVFFDVGEDANFEVLLRKMTDGPNQMVIHTSNKLQYAVYHKNGWYPWQWAAKAAIMLLSILFTWLIFRSFRKNLERRFEQERKLNRLQLLSLKNQMDPHFTLNALDSIDYMYQNHEVTQASQYLSKLTRLIHQTVLQSAEPQITLYEELDFCRNYCQLEQMRQKDFEYHFDIAETELLFEQKIPRQLIFLHVENAIKHGLRPLNGSKKLELQLKQKEYQLQLSIKDNGRGMGQRRSKGTGKGLTLARELIKLHYQLHRKKIKLSIESSEQGTTVHLWM